MSVHDNVTVDKGNSFLNDEIIAQSDGHTDSVQRMLVAKCF